MALDERKLFFRLCGCPPSVFVARKPRQKKQTSRARDAPLQPMSTSTPRTCTPPKYQRDAKPVDRAPKRHKARETPTLDLKQLIPRVMLSQNQNIVRKSAPTVSNAYARSTRSTSTSRLSRNSATSQQMPSSRTTRSSPCSFCAWTSTSNSSR